MAAANPPRPLRRGRAAILFDLDGTLIDSIELILNSARYCVREARAAIGRPTTEWIAGIGIPLFTMFRRYARDAADAGRVHRRLSRISARQPRPPRPLLRRRRVAPSSSCATRGHELAVVTSKSEALAMRGLAHVGLARYMDTDRRLRRVVTTQARPRARTDCTAPARLPAGGCRLRRRLGA